MWPAAASVLGRGERGGKLPFLSPKWMLTADVGGKASGMVFFVISALCDSIGYCSTFAIVFSRITMHAMAPAEFFLSTLGLAGVEI